MDWEVLGKLHAVKKMQKIIRRWYGLECLFADNQYRLRSSQMDKGHEFVSHFFKVQLELNHGLKIIEQDIENISDNLDNKGVEVFDTFFTPLKAVAIKIESEGESKGCFIAYPFAKESMTKKEIKALIDKMVEAGADKDEVEKAVEKIPRLDNDAISRIKDLVELVGEEVSEYEKGLSDKARIIESMQSELSDRYRYHNIIGKSKPMQKVYALLDRIKNSESTVFINGSNGTGKELVAKSIHYNSPRKDKLFLAINCSAFNENLLDSELFGHVKGAFTGALKDKKGFFETADRGTLFLDEIGDTSPSMQVKLLRVIQEGTFIPVGGTTPKKVNVRIICATNKDLKLMMEKGEFREDLFYRINVITLNLPMLKDREGDVDILLEYFLKRKCEQQGGQIKTLARATKEKLLSYHWPGNVRELENEVERMVVLSGEEKVIHPDCISPRILEVNFSSLSSDDGIKTSGKLKPALEQLEALMIKEGLKRCAFNKSKLAKELGISRASLIMKVEKYDLDKRSKKAA